MAENKKAGPQSEPAPCHYFQCHYIHDHSTTVLAAVTQATANVVGGRHPQTGLTAGRLCALYALEAGVMARIRDRRTLAPTITHAGFRFRVIPMAGRHLLAVVTYVEHAPIFGVRPMPTRFRGGVTA